ncbi:hypothetical protein [Rubrivirga sp.]|uniref:hypothetical protein n=1 Tax=Rubrivirga sp. TaxID=1885344 RepID=UPI003C75975D
MSQVLYCIAAVIVFALFGLSRHTTEAHDRRTFDTLEVETAAHDVAQRWAARVRSHSFDEADRLRVEIRRDLGGLTPSADFGLEGGEISFDDVDDFDDVTARRDTAWVGPNRDRALLFDVDIDVRYVALDGAGDVVPSGTPTLAKEARIVVLEADASSALPVRIEVPIQVTAAGQFLHAAPRP